MSTDTLICAVNKALNEALEAATRPLEGRAPEDRWDDGYLNGIKACGAIVQAAMRRAALASPTAEPSLDTRVLYADLCDLWAEANAVDTVIGRPEVLMRKLTELRDKVGRMTGPLYATPPTEPARAAEVPSEDFERGRQLGIQQERALWELAAESQKLGLYATPTPSPQPAAPSEAAWNLCTRGVHCERNSAGNCARCGNWVNPAPNASQPMMPSGPSVTFTIGAAAPSHQAAEPPSEPELKGAKGGNCNVTACQKPGALYFNKSTRRYYCADCAEKINWPGGRADCMELYDVPLLCELDKEDAAPAPSAAVGPVREFEEWLNTKRDANVSEVFHDIVERYRSAAGRGE